MRKPIVGALSTAFLLGMTVSAQAVSVVAPPETTPVVAMGNVSVTLDGNVRMRGFMQQDTVEDNKNEEGSLDTTGFDGRVQLGAKVNAGDGVTGYIRLETGDTTSDVYTWGDANGLTADGGSKKADGANDLSVLEGWLQYQPCNVGIKVGHQLLSHGNKLFYDHSTSGDDAILVFGEMINGANVTGGVVKFEEGTTLDNHDDVDGFYGVYNQKFGDAAMLDANLTYLDNNESGLELWNLGVDGTVKLGMVDLSADVEYQFGTVEQYVNDNDEEVEVDAKGYAVQLKATANLTKTFKLGGLFGYGTGDDGEEVDETGQYVNFLSDSIYQFVIPSYRLAIPGMDGETNTGLTNLMLWQLFAKVDTACPITSKPLALEGRVSYITLNEDVWTTSDAGVAQDEVGVEVAGFATLKITKNLAYKLELAYLFAGDAWDYEAANPNPDDAYFMRHVMELSF